MAVDHFPDITLTRHRFSRAGDKWKHAVPSLQRLPIARDVFAVLGIKLVWESGAKRVPIACPSCGALKTTRDGNYALTFLGGGNFDESGRRNQPCLLECRACNVDVDVLLLLDGYKAKDLDALLDGPLRRYAPRSSVFIVGDVGGKFFIGRTVKEALPPKKLGPVFELTQRLSRVEAMDAAHAAGLVADHHGAMTWRDVPITRDIEPEDTGWHGGRLQVWEQRKLRRQKQVAKTAARKALEADLEAFRQQRATELGL